MGALFSRRVDPVIYLNETAMENVFNYLSCQDLLRCFLVSKHWENFIGNSSVCMRKLELKFHNFQWLSRGDFEMLLSSERKYSCISISNIDISSRVRLILGQFEWKSIKLCHLQFVSELEFLDLLGHFEPSAERIGLKNIKISPLSQTLEVHFIFPKIRHVEISFSSRFIFKKMFRHCREITRLSLDLPCSRFEDEDLHEIVESIQSLMLRNKKLEVLHLGVSTTIFNFVFTESFVLNVEFKLRALKFHRFEKTQQFRNSLALENVEVFLLNQSSTLSRVQLETYVGFNVVSIIFNEMKKLKTLIIKDLHEYGTREDVQFLSLAPNPSITNLNITTFARYHEVFEIILKASPNIQTLRMFSMSQEVLHLLASCHNQLEYLYLECITADEPIKDNAFVKLKFICAFLYISKKFRETIEATPAWRRTNFDQKLINFLNEFKLYWS